MSCRSETLHLKKFGITVNEVKWGVKEYKNDWGPKSFIYTSTADLPIKNRKYSQNRLKPIDREISETHLQTELLLLKFVARFQLKYN